MGTQLQPLSSVPVSGASHEQWIVADVAGKEPVDVCVGILVIWCCIHLRMFNTHTHTYNIIYIYIIILYYIILYYIIYILYILLYYIILYHIILYYIILYYDVHICIYIYIYNIIIINFLWFSCVSMGSSFIYDPHERAYHTDCMLSPWTCWTWQHLWLCSVNQSIEIACRWLVRPRIHLSHLR